jgi:hypothetical protein
MEEEPQPSQVDTGLAPSDHAVKNGREDGDRSSRVKDCSNSEPEQIHFGLHLKAAINSIL